MGRLVIGLGVGASEIDAEVEVLQVTRRHGRWRVAQFATHADSGELPGAALTMGAGAAASGGMTAGVAVGSAVMEGGKSYTSDLARMAARSADRAADYLARVFAREGWMAPPP